MRHINAAATVTPINLLALILLAMPRQAMVESDLRRQIETMLAILKGVPYTERVTVTGANAPQVVEYGLDAQGDLARAASHRRHRAHEPRARGTCHLHPQQRTASVCDAVTDRLLLPVQRRHDHRGRAAPGRPDLSVRGGGAVHPLVRGGAARSRRRTLDALADLGLLQVSATEPRWRRPESNSFCRYAVVAAGADHRADDRALLPGDRAADRCRQRAHIADRRWRSAASSWHNA